MAAELERVDLNPESQTPLTPSPDCEDSMTTTTAPTVAELQKKIDELRSENADLADDKLYLQEQLDILREDQAEAQRVSEASLDRLQRVADDIHDQALHHGSVRFCTTSPCRALNTLVEEYVL